MLEAFEYLQKRFPSYEAYADLVRILQMGALEFESNKRWTSKFLFPYAPEALFEDLNARTLAPDRRFFGRSGELAYLMLARSCHGKQIWDALCPVLYDSAPHSTRWRKALTSLMHVKERSLAADGGGQPVGYLPYESDSLFDRYGEDFLQILRSGLPEYDALPYLGRLTAFHLMHYLLVIAALGMGQEVKPQSDSPITYALEIAAAQPNAVRRNARYSYQVNNELPYRRIKTALDAIGTTPRVAQAVARSDCPGLRQALSQWWRVVDRETQGHPTVGEIWQRFESAVVGRHRQHLGKVHHEYGRSCGLASREGTNAYRYAPSDEFLRMLVLANVRNRTYELEYEEFLDLLYRRYGFIVAKRHAEAEFTGDIGEFDANSRRLQDRLTRLGMIRRLSDACSYVVNRYREGGVA